MIVVGIIIAFIVILLLRDIHIQGWQRYGKLKMVWEGDFSMPLWGYIIVALVCQIPMINIILFMIFLGALAVHTTWSPQDTVFERTIIQLRGSNKITRAIKALGTFLNKKV